MGSVRAAASTSTNASWRADERPGDAEPLADEVEAVLEEQLDGPERVERAAELPDRVERGVDVVEREQRDNDVRRAGHEPEPRGGDHGERAFAPAEEPGEVVAGVVLLEPVEAADDAAVGEHGLDAEDLAAGRAVAQHVDTAGVGRDGAADGRGVAGRRGRRRSPSRRRAHARAGGRW